MRGELLWGVVVSQRCCVAVGLSPVLRGGGVSGVGGGVSGDNAVVVRVVRGALAAGVCECTGVGTGCRTASVGVVSGWHR